MRAIVSEKGSWQGVMSRFIQTHLDRLVVEDPFRIRNSNELVEFLGDTHRTAANFAFSVDVEDLFYSIPKKELIDAVRMLIEEAGKISFQNASGVSLRNFLDLLVFYLDSTFVSFKDKSYVQRDGVCIGSCAAPMLCEIFLAFCDRRIAASLDERVVKCVRYVDDFLVFMKLDDLEDRGSVVDRVLDVFKNCSKGLNFTYELPLDGCIQFLEVHMRYLLITMFAGRVSPALKSSF